MRMLGRDEAELTKMLAFVAMRAVDVAPTTFRCRVQIIRDGGGLTSFGDGETRAIAINDALPGQNMDWFRVREKMLDQDVASIMRL